MLRNTVWTAVVALEEWRKAADAGDRRAMLALGRLYAQVCRATVVSS